MSSINSTELTEEQEKFLNSLEEEFKHRYTENDDEFKAALNEKLPLPPIVENWGDLRHRDERHDHYRARCNALPYRDSDQRNARRNVRGIHSRSSSYLRKVGIPQDSVESEVVSESGQRTVKADL